LSSRFPPKYTEIKIHGTITLTVILYECVTWPVTLKGRPKLGMFDSEVLRREFQRKTEEITEKGIMKSL
jgi:hypothetical protein